MIKLCGVAGALMLWIAPAAAQSNAALPADIQAAIRKAYVMPDAETRYLDGSIDLNADGKNEVIVHIVGGGACGTGGCPTLVFTPAGSGYRLVSTITVTNAPIRASPESSQGWRNLIVSVRGGGAGSHDAELAFDGKSYPANPTVASPRVKTATGTSGDVIIKAFSSFQEAKPFPAGASASASQAAGSGPSFDCAKASSAVEKAVCADAGLSALDRTLGDAYAKAMREWPEPTRVKQRAAQRAWVTQRNGCAKASDVKACLDGVYRRRTIEIQITSGQLTAPTPVVFVCKGQESQPFTIAFYNQTDPKSAVVTMGNRQAVVLSSPSGSGARYSGPDAEFWEHQGEATVTWGKDKFTCKR
jgi:uncharacterized protein